MKSSYNSTTQFIKHIAKKDYADAKKALEAIMEEKIRDRVQKSLRVTSK